MAEFRSLLSYMDSAQRDKVLRHYEAMFDEAGPEEEDTLIRILGSPVRQVLSVEKEFQAAAARGEEPFAALVMPELNKEPEEPAAGAEQPAYQDRVSVESFEDVFAAALAETAVPDEPIPSMEEGPGEEPPAETEAAPPEEAAAPEPAEESAEAGRGEPAEEPEPASVPEEPPAVPEEVIPPAETSQPEEESVQRAPAPAEEPSAPGEEDDADSAPEKEEEGEDEGPGSGRVLGAVLVTIPMLVLWIAGFAVSIVLGAVFLAAGAAAALLGGYLASYALSGTLTYMPDLLLVAGGALICFALALLLLWLGLWVLFGGIVRTVKISASVYRKILRKGEKGHG